MRKITPLLILFIALFAGACNSGNDYSDKIYINAVIWTGEEGSELYSAVGIKDNKIHFVGNEYEQFIGSNTE